jgi:hypothetical protein
MTNHGSRLGRLIDRVDHVTGKEGDQLGSIVWILMPVTADGSDEKPIKRGRGSRTTGVMSR